jgi:hypothetical protein
VCRDLNVKEYKSEFCDYIVTKIIGNAVNFGEMDFLAMFEYFE